MVGTFVVRWIKLLGQELQLLSNDNRQLNTTMKLKEYAVKVRHHTP